MQNGMPKTLNVVVGMAGGAVVSGFVFAILDQVFKARMPCAPGQAEDQCGFATFLQVAYSLMGALVVWPIAGFIIARVLTRRQEREEKQRGQR
jgi:hypothetical protein